MANTERDFWDGETQTLAAGGGDAYDANADWLKPGRHAARAASAPKDDEAAKAALAKDAGSDDSPVTVREARTRVADDYAAALVALWQRLLSGGLAPSRYRAEVQALWQQATAGAPPAAQAVLTKLEQQALAKADGFATYAATLDDDDEPSAAQQKSWAARAAGPVWAATLAIAAYRAHASRQQDYDDRQQQAEAGGVAFTDAPPKTVLQWSAQDDDHTCDPCADLDGETWDLDDVPFYPGDADGPCDGGTNCRCSLDPVDDDD